MPVNTAVLKQVHVCICVLMLKSDETSDALSNPSVSSASVYLMSIYNQSNGEKKRVYETYCYISILESASANQLLMCHLCWTETH